MSAERSGGGSENDSNSSFPSNPDEYRAWLAKNPEDQRGDSEAGGEMSIDDILSQKETGTLGDIAEKDVGQYRDIKRILGSEGIGLEGPAYAAERLNANVAANASDMPVDGESPAQAAVRVTDAMSKAIRAPEEASKHDIPDLPA